MSDTANYPGIMLATDHDPLPFSGQTVLANNALYRCGGAFWGEAQKFGAITLFPHGGGAVPGVTITGSANGDIVREPGSTFVFNQ